MRARNGLEAVFRAKREKVNAAVLVSTGKEMDFAETALNLRDVDSELEILILADGRNSAEQLKQRDLIARAIPQVRVVTSSELKSCLGLSSDSAKPQRS